MKPHMMSNRRKKQQYAERIKEYWDSHNRLNAERVMAKRAVKQRLLAGGYSPSTRQCPHCTQKIRFRYSTVPKSRLVMSCSCGVMAEVDFPDTDDVQMYLSILDRNFCDSARFLIEKKKIKKYYCPACKQHSLSLSKSSFANNRSVVVSLRCSSCRAFGEGESATAMDALDSAWEELKKWILRVTEGLMK